MVAEAKGEGGLASRLEVMISDFVLVSRPTGPSVTDYALASFLARYRGATLRAYQQDLLAFLRWCAARRSLSGTGLLAQAPTSEFGDTP